ncbi:MAG: hypothetical protein AAF483_01385, partial [Planctomycetota bacterium]
ENQAQALTLAVSGKMPSIQEFVARRMAGTRSTINVRSKAPKASPEWQVRIQSAALGFKVSDVGEGGVVQHDSFRNRSAVQTHPLDKKTPCVLKRSIRVPEGKQSKLSLTVSHHPHGDWQLRVLARGTEEEKSAVLHDSIVSSRSIGKNEWQEIEVDLSKYAGQRIQLTLENRANNWANEWAYWHKVEISSSESE